MACSHAIVAFPVIGSDVQPPGRSPANFRAQATQNPPHWIYHLAVSRSAGEAHESPFRPVPARVLDRLAGVLEISGPFKIEPLEYLHGAMPRPAERSKYAFALPSRFSGQSYLLPLAVGLVACGAGCPLPPWVLLSGALSSPFESPLPLDRTRKIAQKIHLALGDDPAYDLDPILDHYYEYPSAHTFLGDRQQRVTPGRVKLLILPTETDATPACLRPAYLVDEARISVADLGRESFDELRTAVEQLAGDDLLVVQVPTAYDALCLLGYQHRYPLAAARLPNGSPFAAYVVRRRRARSGASELLYFRERHLQAAQAHLEKCQGSARDILDKLGIFVELCAGLLKCESGDIAVDEAGGDWLRVVARYGRGMENVPYALPALDITGRAMRTGELQVVDRVAEDPDFLEALSTENPLPSRLREEDWRAYCCYAKKVGSCVAVPLPGLHGTPLGVMRLARHEERPFDRGLVEVVAALARRAAADVARLARDERRPESGPAARLVGDAPDGVSAGIAPADAPAVLGSELARQAMELTGAYRAIVRRVPWGENHLVVCGLSGAEGAWPSDTATQTFPLNEDSAAVYAMRTGQSYLIPDTAQKDIHYWPIAPEARCHAAILLRSGRETLGVLSVDWQKPGACDDARVNVLQQLAGRYALALKALSIDTLFADLETEFRSFQDVPAEAEPDYRAVLETAARMVGARHGALFLRRQETGRYHLAAHLLHNGLSAEQHWYEKEEGVTGWIIKHNRALNVTDLANEAELRAICPDDPPRWQCKLYDGQDRQDMDRSYLGVPVAVGDEVMGVLRLVTRAKESGFTSYDVQVALAVATRLAGWLHARLQARRNRAFQQFAASLTDAKSERNLAEIAFKAVEQAIGPCSCLLRPLDRGGGVRVLRRLAVNNPTWKEACPALLRQGEALAGKVWTAEQRYEYDDAANDPVLREIARGGQDSGLWLIQEGSGVCTRLLDPLGDFVGTFHVHRHHRFALTPGDLAFIEDVAKLLGHWIGPVAKSRARLMELSLHRAAECHLERMLQSPGTDWLDADQLAQVARRLRWGLEGHLGCAWTLGADEVFHCLYSHGLPQGHIPSLPLQAVLRAFGDRRFLAVVAPPASPRPLPWEAGANPLQAALDGCQQAALLLGVDTPPLALFLVAVQPPGLSSARVESAARTMERMGRLILLGQRLRDHG